METVVGLALKAALQKAKPDTSGKLIKTMNERTWLMLKDNPGLTVAQLAAKMQTHPDKMSAIVSYFKARGMFVVCGTRNMMAVRAFRGVRKNVEVSVNLHKVCPKMNGVYELQPIMSTHVPRPTKRTLITLTPKENPVDPDKVNRNDPPTHERPPMPPAMPSRSIGHARQVYEDPPGPYDHITAADLPLSVAKRLYNELKVFFDNP